VRGHKNGADLNKDKEGRMMGNGENGGSTSEKGKQRVEVCPASGPTTAFAETNGGRADPKGEEERIGKRIFTSKRVKGRILGIFGWKGQRNGDEREEMAEVKDEIKHITKPNGCMDGWMRDENEKRPMILGQPQIQ
jgi:hypothetical protein